MQDVISVSVESQDSNKYGDIPIEYIEGMLNPQGEIDVTRDVDSFYLMITS